MTTTPMTRAPYFSGTAIIDSSMSSVPGIVTAQSISSALGIEQRLTGRRGVAGDSLAELRLELLGVLVLVGAEVAAPGDRDQILARRAT